MARTPGSCEKPPATSICSWAVLFFRSFHGFVTMPAKPPPGVVIWNVFFASGNEWKTS